MREKFDLLSVEGDEANGRGRNSRIDEGKDNLLNYPRFADVFDKVSDARFTSFG